MILILIMIIRPDPAGTTCSSYLPSNQAWARSLPVKTPSKLPPYTSIAIRWVLHPQTLNFPQPHSTFAWISWVLSPYRSIFGGWRSQKTLVSQVKGENQLVICFFQPFLPSFSGKIHFLWELPLCACSFAWKSNVD